MFYFFILISFILISLLIFITQIIRPVYTLFLVIFVNLILATLLWLLNLEFFSFTLILVIVGALAIYFLITLMAYFRPSISSNIFISNASKLINIFYIWVAISSSLFYGLKYYVILNNLFNNFCYLIYINPPIYYKLFLRQFNYDIQILGFLRYHKYSFLTLLTVFLLFLTIINISFIFKTK